jgi:ribose transport system ATP-binding protein
VSLALDIRKLVKTHGSTVALREASVEIEAGSAHAIVGENGAGKSTLVKILAGLVRPDEGEVFFHGEELALSRPEDALGHGISTAFQELSLVPDLTVAQNMFLPTPPARGNVLVSERAARHDAARVLEEWEVSDIDVQAPVRELSLANKQKVEIVRALSRPHRLLILDEPTSALGQVDVEWLFRQGRRVQQERGVTVIFVSHRLSEVRSLCDSVTVLRNGARAGVAKSAETSDATIIQMMIGESLVELYPPPPEALPQRREDALTGRALVSGDRLRGVSFDLRWGEILGVAGLQEHGQRDFFLTLFGATRLDAGEIRVGGKPVKLRSPRDAIRAGLGISLVPEERSTEGAFLRLTGRANVTMPSLRRFSTLGWISGRKERRAVLEALRRLDISERALVEPVEAFSGGNQQKIVIAKWLVADSRILLMYDPTRGVDVRTKSEIFHLMRDFAEDGGAVLYYSTDLDEIVNLCDRAIVFYRGRIAAQLTRDALSSENLLTSVLGGTLRPVAAT